MWVTISRVVGVMASMGGPGVSWGPSGPGVARPGPVGGVSCLWFVLSSVP